MDFLRRLPVVRADYGYFMRCPVLASENRPDSMMTQLPASGEWEG